MQVELRVDNAPPTADGNAIYSIRIRAGRHDTVATLLGKVAAYFIPPIAHHYGMHVITVPFFPFFPLCCRCGTTGRACAGAASSARPWSTSPSPATDGTPPPTDPSHSSL